MSGRGRAARLRAQLGERDQAVLSSLAQLRLLTGRQVQRLHVVDGSSATQARRTRALLQRLTDLRLVVRLTRRVGGIRAGSDGHIHGLSGLGQAVLGVDGPFGRRRRSIGDTKPWFQDHVLAVAELAVELTTYTRDGLAELLVFDAEPACWRRFTGSGGQLITLKPDAFVRIGLGEFEQQAFIEMDLDTESLPTIEGKCRRYLAYWRSGQQQQEQGVFPRVWWLTPTEQRLRGITGVVQRLAHDAQALFTVVLRSEATQRLTHWPTAGVRS